MSVNLDLIKISEQAYIKAMISLAALTAIGGVFFILAALQVLPCGVNAISQLSLGGMIGAGVAISSPLIVALLVRLCMSKSDEVKPDKVIRKQYQSEQFNGDEAVKAVQDTGTLFEAHGEF